jgi:hypothetical protein
MDLSGVKELVLKEYAVSKGLLFENHLYGCFSLLEKRIDASGVVLDCSFNLIGTKHGFFADPRTLYTGSSSYQSFWMPLLTASESLSGNFVDALEDLIFDEMRDISSVYFSGALESGELPEDLVKLAEASFVKRRRLPRTRSKQAITPLQRVKGLTKTRRKKVVDHLV